MKGKWWVFLAWILASCQSMQEDKTVSSSVEGPKRETQLGLPGVEEFFEQTAIESRLGQGFTVGDNLAGYYETVGRVYTVEKGYLMKNDIFFMNFASTASDKLLDRTGPQAREFFFPYGHETRFPSGHRESFTLFSQQYALGVEVQAPQPEALGAVLFFKALPEDLKIEKRGQVWLIGPGIPPKDASESPLYAAVTSVQGFTAQISPEDPLGTVESIQELKDTGTAVYLNSSQKVQKFTVITAFGFTPEEAVKKAQTLSAQDPVRREIQKHYDLLTKSFLWTDDRDFNRALVWAKASAYSMVVQEFGKGIWAGLPWFKDNWGRDTFISLPGTLVVPGHFKEAQEVLENFAKFQNTNQSSPDYGRIPNRVRGPKDIIYNTVDGTPWMIREVYELLRYTGDQAFAQSLFPLIQRALEGAIAKHTDADGMLTHDDADTWMDARIAGAQPWSARGNRAVEIQALWYTSLRIGAYLAQQKGETALAAKWGALADKLKGAFEKKFWDGKIMADRLTEQGRRDTKVRPNQLMTISVPFEDRLVGDGIEAQVVKNSVSELLFPYGITSLSQKDPYFHPLHQNNEYHHKDAAYHNGTIWGWNAGPTITALTKFGQLDLSWKFTQNLSQQILGLGYAGTMSELLNALEEEGKIRPSGTYAQAWSVAEFVRNAYQDYLGFRPNLLENTLQFVPGVPQAWKTFKAVLPYGDGEFLEVAFQRDAGVQKWAFIPGPGAKPRTLVLDYLTADSRRLRVSLPLTGPTDLVIQKDQVFQGSQVLPAKVVQEGYEGILKGLDFAKPRTYNPKDFPVTRGRDVLKDIILQGKFQ